MEDRGRIDRSSEGGTASSRRMQKEEREAEVIQREQIEAERCSLG